MPPQLTDTAFSDRPSFDGLCPADFARIEAHARSLLADSRGSHDWDHTLRVCRLCEHIGRKEGADLDVLKVAAYLHDIGRSHQDAADGAICHAAKGEEMARDIVAGLPLAPDRGANVLHCIRTHRFRNANPPRTLEARILFDADKLDAIGAVGVARTFLFAGEVGARLHNPEVDFTQTRPYSREDTGYREFNVKLRKIKDRMLTDEGRRLAVERHRYMEDFFLRLQEEHEGKR